MEKDCTCGLAVLSVLILVFSFWQIGASKWIIVAAAALILIKSAYHLAKHGCSCKGGSCAKGGTEEKPKKGKKKQEVSITGDLTAKMPSKKELKESMAKPVKKKAAKAA